MRLLAGRENFRHPAPLQPQCHLPRDALLHFTCGLMWKNNTARTWLLLLAKAKCLCVVRKRQSWKRCFLAAFYTTWLTVCVKCFFFSGLFSHLFLPVADGRRLWENSAQLNTHFQPCKESRCFLNHEKKKPTHTLHVHGEPSNVHHHLRLGFAVMEWFPIITCAL